MKVYLKFFSIITKKPENENEDRQQLPRNKVLSYECNEQNKGLVNSKLILDLPAEPGSYRIVNNQQ
jgi:hypothetical protein